MRSLFLNVRLSLLFFIALFVIGCSTTSDPEIQKASSISYLINPIEVMFGEGAVSSVPTVVGASPFTFSIAKITSTDDNYLLDPDDITIDSSTGVITLNTNNELPIGIYVLDVAVANKGGTATFTDVLTINIIANIPDAAGKWIMTSSLLIDGDVSSTGIDPLSIMNFPDGTGGTLTLQVSAGQSVLPLVWDFLAELACADVANYSTFNIELTSDNKLLFNCPAESIVNDRGTWVFVQDNSGDYTIMIWTVTLEGEPIPIPITFTNYSLSPDELTFSGQIVTLPMVIDFSFPLSAANAQFIAIDVVFTKVE